MIKDNLIKTITRFYASISKKDIVLNYFFFFNLMPIGIPKVPFRSPGEEDASWVDV